MKTETEIANKGEGGRKGNLENSWDPDNVLWMTWTLHFIIIHSVDVYCTFKLKKFLNNKMVKNNHFQAQCMAGQVISQGLPAETPQQDITGVTERRKRTQDKTNPTIVLEMETPFESKKESAKNRLF